MKVLEEVKVKVRGNCAVRIRHGKRAKRKLRKKGNNDGKLMRVTNTINRTYIRERNQTGI